jgi:hypothetical protein
LMVSMINLLRGWVWVSELFVGLAIPIASTVPAQARYPKRLKIDENHDALPSNAAVSSLSPTFSLGGCMGLPDTFFENDAELSVLTKQLVISFVKLALKWRMNYLIRNEFG